jgi:putative ABC transport system permease protein
MSLRSDVRHAVRLQLEKPRFAALVILTLALGIGANAAIFSVVNAVVLIALPFREAKQLLVLQEHFEKTGATTVSYLNFLDWRRRSTSFQDMACYRPQSSIILGRAGADRVPSKRVSQGFFRTLGVRFQLGRDLSAEEDAVGAPPSVVIGYGVWQHHLGGSADAVGRTLNVEGVSHVVVGVLPAGFRFAGEAELFLPIHPLAHQEPRYDRDALWVVGRLRPGVTADQAAAEMRLVAKQLEKEYPKENAGASVTVTPLSRWLTGNLDQVSLLLARAVSLVLLLACVNVAGLFLARTVERRREYAIRAAVGAGRGDLVRQSLVEAVVLAVQGGAVGLLLARPLLGTLTVFVAPEQLEAVRVDGRVIAFTLALSCLTAVAFGLLPALAAARLDLGRSLRDRERGAAMGHHRVQDTLVVCQVALAVVLLVGAGLMIRSMLGLLSVDPGLRPEHVVTLEVQGPESRFTKASQTAGGFDVDRYVTLWKNYDKDVLERVQRLPGVESAAMTFPLVFTGGTAQFGVQVEGEGPDIKVLHRYAVSPDYFKVMGIPLLKGRGFTMEDDWKRPNVAIVSATAARTLSPGRDPIGRRFFLPELKEFGPFTIVGVVADTLHDRLDAPPPPQLYISFLQWPSVIVLAIRTPLAPETMASQVRREMALYDKAAPVYAVHAMADHLARATAPARRMSVVLGVLAALALLLAAVGIYAVVTQTVVRRRHEIGVRLALGASPAGILGMFVRRAMLLAGAGAGAGVLAAVVVAGALEQWLVRVSPRDPLTYVAVAGVVGLVALGATYGPARRAAATDPIATLRCE